MLARLGGHDIMMNEAKQLPSQLMLRPISPHLGMQASASGRRPEFCSASLTAAANAVKEAICTAFATQREKKSPKKT